MTREGQDNGLLSLWQEASETGEDGFRQVMQQVVQRILEEELTAFLRAAPSERTTSRRGYRNGYKPRSLKTRVGTLDLMVPKDREGRFQTELFDRYQRSEKALVLAIIQMYLKGVSTRKVKSITEKLCGLDVSRSQVSSLTRRLEEDIQSWRNRMLEKSYPYLVVDARYEKGLCLLSNLINLLYEVTSFPANSIITSSFLSPPLSAGEPSPTPVIFTPPSALSVLTPR